MSTEGPDARITAGPPDPTADVEIAAAGTETVTLRVAGAANVYLRFENTGANDITSAELARTPTGGDDDRDADDAANTELAALMPLAAGQVLVLERDHNAALEWDLTLGSTLGTTFAYSWSTSRG